MRFSTLAAAVLLSGCASGPNLPELPESSALPFDTAVDRAYEAVLISPRDALANGRLGTLLHGLDQFALAEVCYRRAFLLAPDSFRWLYYIADVQASQDDYDAAAATLRHALTLDPNYLPAELKLAEMTLRMGTLPQSEQIHRGLIERDRGSAIAYFGLGRIQAQRGEVEAAAESYRRACDRFPAYGAAHRALAITCGQLGQLAQSREHFLMADKYALSVPPVDDPLLVEVRGDEYRAVDYVRKAHELETQGKLEEAATAQRKALTIDSRTVEAHAGLIRLEGRLGRRSKAEEHFDASVALDPNVAESYYNYGVLLLEESRFQEARASFTRALAANPHYAEALTEFGYVTERERRPRDAEGYYRRAISNKPTYRLAHLRLGSLLMDQGDYEAASAEFDKVLTPQDEKTPQYLYEMGTWYLRTGEREKAAEYIRKAREMAASYGQTKLLDTMDSAP